MNYYLHTIDTQAYNKYIYNNSRLYINCQGIHPYT